ncbi:DUF4862 family protein [Arthrobacter sp. NyZ413]|uniref:DUF4862 family protein n=1 Tax=Arthrobacter sp. NyZ413 TaxID=3144669 RepID=UPI003BF8BCB9
MNTIVYSAYNAAPARLSDDFEAEEQWYPQLRSEPRIGGLELPVLDGRLHPRGLATLAGLLDPGWSNTVSAMSMTLSASRDDPLYGLASRDPAGRRRALDDISSAHAETLQLREQLGPSSIRAFVLQSAPRADRSSLWAFTESLREIAGWDWANIELLIEHSDALIGRQPAQKGYLGLEEEIEAVQSASGYGPGRIRHLINWGRSAIEGRNARTPSEHVAKLGDGLGAFAFSGAAPTATNRSAEWEDAHLGLAADEPASLLDADGVRELLRQLPDGLNYIGVKTGAPKGSAGADRLRLGLALLDLLPLDHPAPVIN